MLSGVITCTSVCRTTTEILSTAPITVTIASESQKFRESPNTIVQIPNAVTASKRVAKLRLFLVEPDARGLGIGGHMVEVLLTFARAAGYHTVRLWTQSCLLAARRIYARAGFKLVAEAPHHSFGHDLVAETWELRL